MFEGLLSSLGLSGSKKPVSKSRWESQEHPDKVVFRKKKNKLKLMVTLWPSFPHFNRFAHDRRLSGIRLNSAMMHQHELEAELKIIRATHAAGGHTPFYFDIKGKQLRITEVVAVPNDDHLEVVLNHPIEVQTPTIVLFKAGADRAMLSRVEGGNKLVFAGGPAYRVKPGESLHILCPSLKVNGPTFTDTELSKIEMVKKSGIKKWCLSYCEKNRDIDEFREHIGDAELIVKIESKRGLDFVARKFKKKDNLSLMAARGDLYVEIDKPHEIMEAMKQIIEADPEATVGSRLLLSVVKSPVPECADFSDLAWLYDIGYKNMMLCDELCLKEDLLGTAVSAFDAFRDSYAKEG